MKYLIILVFLLILTGCCFGQVGYKLGYYSTDSVFKSGAKVIDRGPLQNSRSCQVEENGVLKEFYPGQIKEYATGTGHVYASKTITVNNTEETVFLEWVFQGKINLYVYRGDKENIFAVGDSTGHAILLPKTDMNGKDFRENLSSLVSGCNAVVDAIQYLKYKRNSLIEFLDRYDKCKNKPFPKVEYGVLGGAGLVSLILPSVSAWNFLKGGNLKGIVFPVAGIFADLPFRVSYLSFHPEFYYSLISCKPSKNYNSSNYEASINLKSIYIPLLARYTLEEERMRPFFNAGYIQVLNFGNNQWYVERDQNPPYTVKSKVNSGVKLFSSGIAVGGGLKFKLTSGKIIMSEIRFTRYFHRWENISYSGSEIRLTVSYVIKLK